MRALVVLALWAPLAAGIAVVWVLAGYAASAPPTPDIRVPLAGHATEIRATDGTRLGGLIRGRRPWIPASEMPARVRMAFLAAEDDAFFEHEGYDLIAIARAYLRNKAAGRVVEGGSTLSQQLAKQYLSTEKRYERKLVEVFLARKIEARWSKEQILEAYLNEVYLGSGANGVQAAAEIYFHKNLDELTWAEATLIAGITSSPSAWSPFRRPEMAIERRRLVLLRLGMLGVLTDAEIEAHSSEPVGLRTDWDGDVNTAPYATVEVREALKRAHGKEIMAQGSADVTVSLSPHLQHRARASMAKGLGELDRRQGYRGPLAALSPARWGVLDDAAAEIYGIPSDPAEAWEPVPSRPYVALVTDAAPRGLTVRIAGRSFEIPHVGARWAHPYKRGSKQNELTLDDLTEQFAVGDVILVAQENYAVWDVPPGARRGKEPRRIKGWRVDQVPRVEGALISAEVDTGYVRAMVGGWDFDRSQFNRATEGCRQPGSVFKPIVYSAALDKGMTPATILTDTPIKIEKRGGEVWKPKNADNDFAGFLLMRDALARSRNLPSVEVFNHVGANGVAQRAKRLGLTTPMARTEALSLGSSCVKVWDMTRVYGSFARHGVRMEPRLILSIQNRRSGNILYDDGHFSDAQAPTLARLDRLVRASGARPPRVLKRSTAFMLMSMLRAVVYGGTAYAATALGVPAAGKTGTTNAFDAWFVGFTESLVTTVWAGADNNDRALGKRESGGRVALPIWLRFMQDALAGRPQGGLQGEPPESVEIHRIDRETGLRVKPGEPGVDLPFVVGTAPQGFAPDRKEKAARQVDERASRF